MPIECCADWVARCRPALGQYAAASATRDLGRMEEAFEELLLIPTNHLVRARGGKKRQRRVRQLLKQLACPASPAISVPHPAPALDLLPPSDPAAAAAAQLSADPEAVRVRRAARLVQEGHLSRASSALSQAALAEPTAEVAESLRALHPAAPPQTAPPPDDAPTVWEIEDNVLTSALLHLCDGAAPGPSGWSAELVRPLLLDAVCRAGFAALIRDIHNGTPTPAMSRLLLACRLLAIQKPLGGHRPIAIGELFYKWTAVVALRGASAGIRSALPKIQYGVGVPGGPERAALIAQTLAEAAGPDGVVVIIDAVNAFNTIDRSAIFQRLQSVPALRSLWRLVWWAYGGESALLLHDQAGNLVQQLASCGRQARRSSCGLPVCSHRPTSLRSRRRCWRR